MLKVEEALKNIDIVVANTSMNRAEHAALIESVKLVSERCELADKLEAEKAVTMKPLCEKEKIE